MRILAYCDAQYLKATRRVVGKEARVVSSPPLFAADLEPCFFEGYDVIYLDLHGEVGGGYLYSAAKGVNEAALSFQTVQRANLDGAVIIATTCNLPDTPFSYAFHQGGASAVIAGAGLNWATRNRLSGAQLLAKHIITAMQQGYRPEKALDIAKHKLRWSLRRLWDRKATRDALAFKQLKREVT